MVRLAFISTTLIQAAATLPPGASANPVDTSSVAAMAPPGSGSSTLSNIVAVINGFNDDGITLNEVLLLQLDICKPITSQYLQWSWKKRNSAIIVRGYKNSTSRSCLCDTSPVNLDTSSLAWEYRDVWCVKAI